MLKLKDYPNVLNILGMNRDISKIVYECDQYKNLPDALVTSQIPSCSYNVSPETMQSKKITTKTDVWAMGTLCFEIIPIISNPLAIPTFGVILTLEFAKIREGLARLKCPRRCPPVLFAYITEKLLHEDPRKRPNFTRYRIRFAKY